MRNKLNLWLFLALLCTVALCLIVKERDVSRPNYDFLPEAQMAYTAAYDSFAPNLNFPNGLTLRSPPTGTIARGYLPLFRYQPTSEDALRAGRELKNPFSEDDSRRLKRGSDVFDNVCQICHGPIGEGNGPVTQRGFPLSASLLAERAVRMKDGQMFHVLTYGQGRMPALAAQLSPEDRWSAILHVRMLQGPNAPSHVPSRIELAKLFRENCSACHGDDGTGNRIRKVLPLIPDFTSLAWQMSQTDLAIVNQIDYGSLPLMPSFRYKLPSEQILSLALYVRTFAPRAVGAPVPSTSHLTAAKVYGTYCFVCHDSNGKGNPLIREVMHELPDFTSVAWQKTRTDADFTQSILLGKGKFMLPMSDTLGDVDGKQLVVLVRDFQKGQVIPVEEPTPGGSPVPEIVRIPEKILSSSNAAGQKVDLSGKTSAQVPLIATSEDTAARIRIGANIFRQYCIVCHGVDGKGTLMRPVLPAIPDFTSPAFQKEHSNAQLLVSILDGKGTMMPANRDRITEDQAGDLVPYVRAFGPQLFITKGTPGASNSEFEKSFRQLEEQWNALERELQKTKGKQ